MDFNVLIIGGGIQGVGLLHDLASRRIPDVHLLEERTLSIGTSSRSTKLLHGGLRYLERPSQWPLVAEALRERGLLLKLLGKSVKPLPFVLPASGGDRPAWMLRAGLSLYDLFAGDSGLPHSRSLSPREVSQLASYLKESQLNVIHKAFLYYDGQMLDDVIVRLAAAAAECLGASYEEESQVTGVGTTAGGGFVVKGRNPNGAFEYTAKSVVLTTGAWNNWNLLRWGMVPKTPCILNVGSHLVLSPAVTPASAETSAATLIQHSDGRVLFFIPWFGKWLFGTTESSLQDDPRRLSIPEVDRTYLLHALEEYFDLSNPSSHIEEAFAGVRTMPLKSLANDVKMQPEWSKSPFSSPFYASASPESLSRLSRETVVSEPQPQLFCVYGGKYTTYRSHSQKLGRMIKDRLGIGGPSLTSTREAWNLDRIADEHPEIWVSNPNLRDT